MLTLVCVGAAFVPLAMVGWVLAWLAADVVAGTAPPAVASVRTYPTDGGLK